MWISKNWYRQIKQIGASLHATLWKYRSSTVLHRVIILPQRVHVCMCITGFVAQRVPVCGVVHVCWCVLMFSWSDCYWLTGGSMAAFLWLRLWSAGEGEEESGWMPIHVGVSVQVCVHECDYRLAQWAYFCRASGRAWCLWLELFLCF